MSARGFLSRMENTMPWMRKMSGEGPRFNHPDDAPIRKLLSVKVSDGSAEYVYPHPCVRKLDGGWVSAKTGKPLSVDIIGWRYGHCVGTLATNLTKVRRA